MKIKKDLSGKRFGKLVVLCPSQTKQYYFVCKCDCGNIVEVYRSNLGRCTRSCGCLQKERTSKANTKHGETGTRLFRIWNHMKQRCFNKNNQDYKNYGGRGISVCEEWEKYNAFRDWALSNGYKVDLTIERKNSNGNYSPDNCCWATKSQQAKNRRMNYIYKDKCLRDWCKEKHLSYSYSLKKLHKGISLKEIIGE